MTDWLGMLPHNPIPLLLSAQKGPLSYLVRRDLLEENVAPVEGLWADVGARRILARERPDGRWMYPGGSKRIRSREDYDQIESYRQLGLLVEKFSLTRRHPMIRKASEFVFSHQTKEGDIRGIYGRQYSPNYTAGIMELLIKAGYQDDERVERGFRWLLSMRQDDGGWAIPMRTAARTSSQGWTEVMKLAPVLPDRSKPSSHLVTGVVLRAFAAHHRRRASREAQTAGRFLCGRFFKSDAYADRKGPEFWWRVSFPFWFTDIVSALDSLSLLGFTRKDPAIEGALTQLRERQNPDGSFRLKLLRTGERETSLWVTFAICRVLKRLYGMT